LLNTSKFEVFKRGHSHESQEDNIKWSVKEDFVAFNGWNNNKGDKLAVNKYFELLFDEKDESIYLAEISFL
jgi:hypothetical protein